MSEFKYRPNNFPPIVKNLIIINVLVFIAQLSLDSKIDLTDKLVLYPLQHPKFQPYQIATHMFAHSPQIIFHIVFNMFALWMFGRILENVWGPKRFLLFYLLCGVGAAALHLGIQYYLWEHAETLFNQGNFAEAQKIANRIGPALGASGAIMGVVVAFAYLFPNTQLYLMFIPIPVKAKWAILAYVLYDLVFGITGGDNVAHFAHLGGAITGFLLVLIWNKTDRKRFY
jgi:membrane associated rhomboid family serine protease